MITEENINNEVKLRKELCKTGSIFVKKTKGDHKSRLKLCEKLGINFNSFLKTYRHPDLALHKVVKFNEALKECAE